MKRFYKVIIDHGYSAEEFFEAIRYKNSWLENNEASDENEEPLEETKE